MKIARNYFHILVWAVVLPFIMVMMLTPTLGGFNTAFQPIFYFATLFVLNYFLLMPFLLPKYPIGYYASLFCALVFTVTVDYHQHSLLNFFLRIAGCIGVFLLSHSLRMIDQSRKKDPSQYIGD